MGYWQTKVVPKLKKVFDKDGKKAAAIDACKSFEGSKEEINKQCEEKKPELQTKVVAIYEASSTEIKALVKNRKTSGVKKYSDDVQKFLNELEGIDFPGTKQVCEASKTLSPALVAKPILFILEKVSTFVVIPEVEVKDKELSAEEIAAAAATTTSTTEPTEKEVAVVAEPVPETAPVVSVPAEVAEPVKAEIVAAEPAAAPPAAKP